MLLQVNDHRVFETENEDSGLDTRTEFPTLSRAPITEALIDIQARLPKETTLEVLASFQDAIKDQFPERKERKAFEAQFKLDDSGVRVLSAPAAPDGFLFYSRKADALVVQARLDGFTFSKLQPYTEWKHIRPLATSLWNHYVSIAKPESVSRVAVRYINRIELPVGAAFKDHLLTVPEIAKGLPQGLPDFLMRLVLPHPSGAIAIITQGVAERPPDNKTFPFVFDIDVYREVDLEPMSEEIWNDLEELRIYKNRIFFNSMTEGTLERFK
jgi:uncharacterized protein (TIGR04255 family)